MTRADIVGTAQLVVRGIDLDGNGEYAINPDDPFARQESSIAAGHTPRTHRSGTVRWPAT